MGKLMLLSDSNYQGQTSQSVSAEYLKVLPRIDRQLISSPPQILHPFLEFVVVKIHEGRHHLPLTQRAILLFIRHILFIEISSQGLNLH